MGVSMGGLIRMTAALAQPGRLTSLVLCDTTACDGSSVRPMWVDRVRVSESDGMTSALVDHTMAIWFTEAFRTTRREVVESIAFMLRSTDPRGYAAARAIHERIAGSELLVIPAKMHGSVVEDAGRFLAALLDFLGARS